MTSGNNTGALRPYTAIQMTEAALRQAGVKQAMFTSETLDIAMDVFNRMLDDMLNLGLQLWGRDRVVLPPYFNRQQGPLPLGTPVGIDLQQRTLLRPQPLLVQTDQGGDASLAFDGNLSTVCQQTAIDGSITAIYQGGTVVTQLGVMFVQAGPQAFFVEYSMDGITWQAIDMVSVTIDAPNTWFWKEIDGAPPALGWRLRNVSTQPLVVAEVYFGNNPQDIPIPPFTYDDWDALPNKNTPGQPIQWFQDRQLAAPILFVWPVPDATALFMTLVTRRRRFLNQITDWQQSLDITSRWYEGITASLARRLCKEVEGAELGRMPMLLAEEASAMQLATGEERDPAPSRYNPGLEVYNF